MATPTKIDLKALDQDLFVLGDNAIARTITVGQQVTVSDIFVVDTATFSINAAGKVTLPQINDAASPTLAFGDGDTGFFEQSDDLLGISIGGVQRYLLQNNLFGATNANGGFIVNLTASATQVTIGPRRGDLDTGLGGADADTLALITGGTTAILIDASQRVGIIGTPTADGLTIQHGGITQIMGADNQAATLTDATAKNCRIGIPHYSNGATPSNLLYANNTLVANLVNYGGGTGLLNAATELKFYTALTTTTTSGTVRMTINKDGQVILPLVNDATKPNFAFGDGDTGFFEQADDILDVATAGAKRFIWSGNFYQSSVLNGAWMRNLNATATEPNVGPDISENTTGMGSAGTDQISLITAAVEAINISATQETTIQGTLAVSNATEGNTAKLSRKTATETHTLSLATTSDTTTISIPSGARLLAVSFNVDTAVTNGGDNTWSAAFITGSTTTLATAAAAAQNTKVDLMLPDEISSAVCEIQFTPQGGSFTAGVIEIVAYYEILTSLANV